jgi:hypothetical protein
MKKIIVFVCMALIFPNILLLANNRQNREKKVAYMLKLTDEQQKKFEDITAQFKKNMLDIRATIQKNRIDLKKMVAGETVDEKLLVQLTDENSKLQGEMKSIAVKRWLEINKILDKDQKETWAKMLGRVTMMRDNMKGRMKNFMMNKHPMRNRDRDNDEW